MNSGLSKTVPLFRNEVQGTIANCVSHCLEPKHRRSHLGGHFLHVAARPDDAVTVHTDSGLDFAPRPFQGPASGNVLRLNHI
jgi:hypothetical protein